MDNRTRNLMMGAAGVDSKTYIEDVFSTYLYTGNGSSQTITNGIDLSGKGGLVWTKQRSGSFTTHNLFDTARGRTQRLDSSTTSGQSMPSPDCISSFDSSGFTLGSNGTANASGEKNVSWTFRKAAKFFDVVTWTGDGNASRQISHALGSTPGCAFIKRTDSSSNWVVHHRGFTSGAYVAALNLTDGQGIQTGDNWSPSTTTFNVYNSVLTNWATNINGATYVAYLFAHDTTADGMIQCGSFTTNGSGNATVSLGWEPQWLLFKPSSTTGSWLVADSLRGLAVGSSAPVLQSNSSSAESNMSGTLSITPTGFSASSLFATSSTYIYIAIRRGPMKTPTSGASVFNAITRTGTNTNTAVTGVGFTPDLVFSQSRPGGYENQSYDRLRGKAKLLIYSASPESATGIGFDSFNMDGLNLTADSYYGINGPSIAYVNWLFRRAPGFFDVVAYMGTGASTVCSHSLAATPELIIIKRRNAASSNWVVTNAYSGDLTLNQNSGANGSPWSYNITAPTNTQFWPRNGISNGDVNESGGTFIAYLFASCPGVSKVGFYTGTGTTLQINCGFTNGARFVLIKRTDSTGDWYVWDTARGIVAANDPYLLLNSTAAEVTNTDYIDPYAAGFEISSTDPAAINALNGSYIYLAIA